MIKHGIFELLRWCFKGLCSFRSPFEQWRLWSCPNSCKDKWTSYWTRRL